MNEAEMVKAGLDRISGQVDVFCGKQKEKTGELQARLLELEQKAARRGGGDPGASFGGYDSGALHAALEGSTDLQAVAAGKMRRAVIDLPANYWAAITSTGIAPADQRSDIVAPVTRRRTIRSLIPSVPTTGGSISYLQETGFTNNAATVSETIEKPESDLVFTLKTSAIVTIAHWIRATTQVLSDIPTLQQYIDGRLRYGLAYVEETQLLKGSGSGNNLQGLYTAATAYSAPISVPAPSKIDTIMLMVLQLAIADYAANGIVLHPSDWAAMQLKKDSTGKYLFGDPRGSAPPAMWGISVIPTTAMTVDTALVGAFDQAALIYDREDARVDISTETGDDFTTNRCHVRAEERLALAILRPGALIKNADLVGS